MEIQGTQNSQKSFGKKKLEESFYLILKLTTKVEWSRECGIYIKVHISAQFRKVTYRLTYS